MCTITYLGHSGFLLSDGTNTVAIDPWLNGNPVATMSADDVECDAIVATHGHADHFADVCHIAQRCDAVVYGAFELTEHCTAHGVARTEPMNPGGRVEAPWGWVALVHAFHSSAFEGQYMGMPCGAIVHVGGKTIYHCGDTGLFGDMALFGEIYQPDVACVPIGDRFTMGPDLATRAAEMIGAPVAIPIHYNTFPPIRQDPAAFAPQGVEVRVMAPGEATRL